MLKKIGTDILGVLLIILAILTGWFPGPGGLPLLIAGLGLLSINHEWARHWLKKAQDQTMNMTSRLFGNRPIQKLAVDITGLIVLLLGILFYMNVHKYYLYPLAIFICLFGIFLLLGNRKRIQKIIGFIKAQAK